MKSLFLATSLLATMATSAFAGVAPGCIGGCLPTALAAPTPALPAGYQCKANFPGWPVMVSCVNVDESPLTGAANNPHPAPTPKHKV